MSYKEKSILLTLGLTLYLLYYYYSGLNGLANTNALTEESFTYLLMTTAIWLTSLAIGFHIIVAAVHAKEAEEGDDERDKQIEILGTRNAYYVLVFGIISAVAQTQFSHFSDIGISFSTLSSGYNIIHYVIVSFLIAEIVKYISQLYYYRRGF